MGTPKAERDPARRCAQAVRIERRRLRIAQRIIEAAKGGERDPVRFAEAALATCREKRSAKGYTITSLAPTRRAVGTARPSALAVLRLISSSYLAGACAMPKVGRVKPLPDSRYCPLNSTRSGHLAASS
jgi:hypothetical protein